MLAATPSAKVGVQTADVSQAAQVAQAVELGEKELGPVDVCIASAGASIPKYFEDLTHEDFAKMMSVNYFGGMPQRAPNPRLADPRQVCYSRVHALPWTVVNIAKAVLPGMVSRGEGQFAAVSSMAACVPFVGYAAYAPAKVGAA